MTEKLVQAINDQIIAELWSSNLYLQMSLYLKAEGWDGCAHWLELQAAEEKEHAMTMADYIIKRGGRAKIGMIDTVPEGWGSVADVFEHVYKHECHVSALIDNLVDIASSEKDKASQDFLWGFVREQVEEEATAASIVSKIKNYGELGLHMIDSELGQRQ